MQVLYDCCTCKCCMVASETHQGIPWNAAVPISLSLHCPKYIVRAQFHALGEWINKGKKHDISRWNKESKAQEVCSPSSDTGQLLLVHTDFLTKASLLTTGQHPHLCAFCFPSGYSFLIPAYQHSSWKYVNAYVLTCLCTCPHFLPIPESSPTAKVHYAFLFP